MSIPYIGEIRLFPYLRGAPQGWLLCDGSTPAIASYEALAALIGTTYGGDGSQTFGLPDLRGRVPIGAGPANPLAASVGQETVTLTAGQLPGHNHYVEASTSQGTSLTPGGQVFAATPSDSAIYLAPTTVTPVPMAASMIGSSGGGLPHENCAPTLAILACIAWDGMYPTQG